MMKKLMLMLSVCGLAGAMYVYAGAGCDAKAECSAEKVAECEVAGKVCDVGAWSVSKALGDEGVKAIGLSAEQVAKVDAVYSEKCIGCDLSRAKAGEALKDVLSAEQIAGLNSALAKLGTVQAPAELQ